MKVWIRDEENTGWCTIEDPFSKEQVGNSSLTSNGLKDSVPYKALFSLSCDLVIKIPARKGTFRARFSQSLELDSCSTQQHHESDSAEPAFQISTHRNETATSISTNTKTTQKSKLCPEASSSLHSVSIPTQNLSVAGLDLQDLLISAFFPRNKAKSSQVIASG